MTRFYLRAVKTLNKLVISWLEEKRFLQVINSRGYESVNQLMIVVETVICGNKEEGIRQATNNRNYSKICIKA